MSSYEVGDKVKVLSMPEDDAVKGFKPGDVAKVVKIRNVDWSSYRYLLSKSTWRPGEANNGKGWWMRDDERLEPVGGAKKRAKDPVPEYKFFRTGDLVQVKGYGSDVRVVVRDKGLDASEDGPAEGDDLVEVGSIPCSNSDFRAGKLYLVMRKRSELVKVPFRMY